MKRGASLAFFVVFCLIFSERVLFCLMQDVHLPNSFAHCLFHPFEKNFMEL